MGKINNTEEVKQVDITEAESIGYIWYHLDDFDPTTSKTYYVVS